MKSIMKELKSTDSRSMLMTDVIKKLGVKYSIERIEQGLNSLENIGFINTTHPDAGFNSRIELNPEYKSKAAQIIEEKTSKSFSDIT